MTPIRLLAIIEAYSITGPAKNLIEFAMRARGEGVETTVATFQRGGGSNLFLDTLRKQEIPFEVIEERGAYDIRTLKTLRDLNARHRPDILQTHAVKSHFLARSAGLHKDLSWVAFHHGYTWPTLKTRLNNQLDRWSLRGANKIITVSHPFREQLVGQGVHRDRIEILSNSIALDWGARDRETNQAKALRDRLKIPASSPVILIVGRLSREKDHITLLEAVHQLAPRYDPHLVVVGEGPERPRIEEKIGRLGLSGNVTLIGQQDSAEPYYGIADIAVLSSLSEGSPNALLEAMAAGVPVVATNVGGIPETVTSERSALLVDPRDSISMSKAIGRILEDREGLGPRLVNESREIIRNRYDPEVRMKRLVEIYRSVLNR